jgi:hypothetical protein
MITSSSILHMHHVRPSGSIDIHHSTDYPLSSQNQKKTAHGLTILVLLPVAVPAAIGSVIDLALS